MGGNATNTATEKALQRIFGNEELSDSTSDTINAALKDHIGKMQEVTTAIAAALPGIIAQDNELSIVDRCGIDYSLLAKELIEHELPADMFTPVEVNGIGTLHVIEDDAQPYYENGRDAGTIYDTAEDIKVIYHRDRDYFSFIPNLQPPQQSN